MWHRLNSYKTTLQCHDVSHSISSSSHVQLELYHASGKLREKSSVLSSRLKAARVVDEIASSPQVVPGVSHVNKCDWLVKNMTDWRLEVDLGQLNDWRRLNCREYDWRRRLCIGFVVCYCSLLCTTSSVVLRAPTTCSEYSFSCSCLNLCIICNVYKCKLQFFRPQAVTFPAISATLAASAVDKRNCVYCSLHSELRAFRRPTLYIVFPLEALIANSQ